MKIRLLVAAFSLSASLFATAGQADVSIARRDLEKTTLYPENPISIQTSASTFLLAPTVSVNVGITPTVDVGATGAYTSGKFSSFDSLGASVHAHWFKSGLASDSLYVKPVVGYAALETSASENNNFVVDAGQKAYIPSLSALVGYQWMFGNGFNVHLGAGASYAHPNKEVTVKAKKEQDKRLAEWASLKRGPAPAAELLLGYAF